MVVSQLQMDFRVTGRALTTNSLGICAPRRMELMRRLLPETGGLEVLSHLAEKVCQASPGEDGLPAAEIQESLWQLYFSDPTQWWDNRRSKPTSRHPDFKHKESKIALWLNNRLKLAWVESQLVMWDEGTKMSPHQSGSTSILGQGAYAAHEDRLEVAMCRKLCEEGRITDSVDALTRLVQRGCHVDNNLFYCVLKECIAKKDLALGRRIHALTVESGYEGDAFLATHLIGLYASHTRLEEAMQVFTKVTLPSAYNWATIIFAYARNGEAAQAIRLYRQMRESAVKPSYRIYIAVLKACASAGDLVAGKEVHDHILANADKPDIFVQTGLLDMYAKCGCLEDARTVFDKLPDRDVVAWNAMIAGYAQKGMGQEALGLYRSMQQEGLSRPNSVTFVSLLQACASVGVGAVHEAKKLHAQIEERGLLHDVVLGGSLVNMYSKCGRLEDARIVFDMLPDRTLVTWNAMLAGYVQQGMGEESLTLYSLMQEEGLPPPNSVTFGCLLQACACVGVGALHEGKKLHAQIKERGLQDDVVLGGGLVNMYAKCGSLENARSVFGRLPGRNLVTWNAMLAGYAQQGMGEEALALYGGMQEESLFSPDSITFISMLQSCASVGVGALHHGKQLHAQIKERGLQDDVVLGCSLVNMYAKCGSLEDARSLFDRLPDRDVVTWNAMLAGYAQQGMGQEALSLYCNMRQGGLSPPDCVTFVCLLQACASVGVEALLQGKQLHAEIEERGLQDDVVLGSSLVNMYVKCGSLEDARNLFDRLPDRGIQTWNAMLTGYAQQGMGKEALILYNSMHQEGLCPPDCVTFVCLLQACASVGVGALLQGKQVHAQIAEKGLHADGVLGGSLINMYAKCGSLEDASSLFDRLPERSVETWNAMLAGYVQQGMGQEALSLYDRMQEEGLCLSDCVTFVCLLQACAIVAGLPLGKQLHAQIEEQGMLDDVVVGVAIVNMYAKCGSMSDCQQVFDSLPERSVEAWNALISGYTRHGDGEAVFNLLDRMRLEGVQPDGITFLSVLTVCSHVGQVDKGQKYFEAMESDYSISPTVEHYTCMIDVLGRAGHLDEALEMVKTMPFPPSGPVWHTLLSACQKWSNVEIGQQAFESAVRLDGKDDGSYVLMSNIYARAQMWEAAKEMQARRVKCGAWKEPGQSWCSDMCGVVHTFVAGDKTHSERERQTV